MFPHTFFFALSQRPLSSETLPPPFVCVFPDKHLTRINPASKWMLPKDYDALMASCRLVSRGTSISCIGPGFSIHAGRKNRHWRAQTGKSSLPFRSLAHYFGLLTIWPEISRPLICIACCRGIFRREPRTFYLIPHKQIMEAVS